MRFPRKSKSAKVQLLSGVSLFSSCNSRELSRLASLLDEIEVPRGKVLAREGEPGWEFFVVADGRARAAVRGRKVASFGPGGFFGEMSLLDQGPRTATVTAETDVTMLGLTAWVFKGLVEQNPPIATKLLKTMAERLRSHSEDPTH